MRQWQQLGIASRLQNQSVAVAPREFEGKKNMVRKKQHISKTKEQQQKKHMYLCICVYIYIYMFFIYVFVSVFVGRESARNAP